MAPDKSAKSLRDQWVCQLCRPMELATMKNEILAKKASCMDKVCGTDHELILP